MSSHALCPMEAHVAGAHAAYSHPRGWRGRVAGLLMVRRNAALNERAVELLAPRRDDRVLEVGFGPGVALQRLASQVITGLIVGVDISDVMLRQASARVRPLLDEGRILLKQGCATALPFSDELFDRALAVDTAMHWPSTHQGLREIGRVLKPHGRLVVAMDGAGGPRAHERLASQILSAGFRSAELHSLVWEDASSGAAVVAIR